MTDNTTKQEKQYLLEVAQMKSVMESESGRRVLSRLIGDCGVYRTSYNPNMPDMHTLFNEGQRNIGLQLIAKMQEASPALFIKMMQEDNKDED